MKISYQGETLAELLENAPKEVKEKFLSVFPNIYTESELENEIPIVKD